MTGGKKTGTGGKETGKGCKESGKGCKETRQGPRNKGRKHVCRYRRQKQGQEVTEQRRGQGDNDKRQ
jgi:hypothetical protein